MESLFGSFVLLMSLALVFSGLALTVIRSCTAQTCNLCLFLPPHLFKVFLFVAEPVLQPELAAATLP